MTQIPLTDDLSFSRIIAGVMRLNDWGLDAAGLLNWIEACLGMGVTTFDHADIYGGYTCEARFGEALALKPSLRAQMQLVTKCDIMLPTPNRPEITFHYYDTSKAHIIQSAEQSLRNLRTDYLDVLLIHRPDPLMDADEVAEALTELHTAGKVRHFGVSNFSPSQYQLLMARMNLPLVTNQVEFSLLHMNPLYDGTFDQMQKLRVPPMIWSPVGGGRLFSEETPLLATLREIGAAHHATPDQIALAWTMRPPVKAMPVLGTGKLERIQAAVEAEKIELSRLEWFKIWSAATGTEVP
ncbi:MAG: aldo/keto reductase family oxidoreductase [Anaerolineae bacterium]